MKMLAGWNRGLTRVLHGNVHRRCEARADALLLLQARDGCIAGQGKFLRSCMDKCKASHSKVFTSI